MIHCCLWEEYFVEFSHVEQDPLKVVAFMLLKLSWGKFYDCTFIIKVWKV